MNPLTFARTTVDSSPARWLRCAPWGVLVVIGGLLMYPQFAYAVEPYERFVQRLREERYFDLALIYLDDLTTRSNVPDDFKQTIDLERALIYFQAASQLAANAPQRTQRLSLAEESLKKFLQDNPHHQRRGEARLKLGGLLRLRAEEARAAAGPDPAEDIVLAIEYFDEAHKLFESTIAELAEIESKLKGGRVDPSDAQQIDYRDRVRSELREAQLLSAKAVEDRGRSQAAGSDKRQADLKQALRMFAELYSKEQRMIGIRNYALYYRSNLQRELGQIEDAIDGFQRIVDLEGIDVLKPLQTQAMTELIRAWAASARFELASSRADKWLKSLSTDEQNSPESLALRVEYAQLRVDWYLQLKAKDGSARLQANLQRETRSDLRTLLRIAGSHQERARSLLAALGVDVAETADVEKVPSIKDMQQALELAQSRVDRADSSGLELTALAERIQDTNLTDSERQTLQSQQSQLQSSIDKQYRQVQEILHQGLALYDSKNAERSQLYNARYYLAYSLLKLNEFPEAIAVGEFLSRSAPGTSQGLNAASIVLRAFGQLLRAPDADQSALMTQLSSFAEYLVATWPQSAEATAAAGVLTQMAISAKDWQRAERYLQSTADSGAASATQYYELGVALYAHYQQIAQAHGQQAPEAAELKARAERWLELASQRIDAKDPLRRLSVRSALAQLQLSDNQVDQAASLMIAGEDAPMNWLEHNQAQVPIEVACDAYRTALRIVAGQFLAGTLEADAAAAAVRTYVDRLQKVAEDKVDAKARLQATLALVARDMKDQLGQVQHPNQRREFAEMVLLIVGQASGNEAFSTQFWAASTALSIADELAAQDASRTSSQTAYAQASQMLQQMLTKAKQQPDWIQAPEVHTQLKVWYAKAAEGAEDFRAAIQAYGEILDENENLLDVQICVARALQKSAVANPARYESALKGARPHPQTKQNIFWGWGKISQITAKKLDQYAVQFFESRYQLANCRMQWALSHSDSAARTAELVRAERAIIETHSLYPELGGNANQQRFDVLVKQIRQHLGKPPTGLTTVTSTAR
ncbi:MAG: hypothetical protein KF752_15830 [Pirellulaceae bacterium]|nr:hypothetical protein [Pirellulaceae bacterium]